MINSSSEMRHALRNVIELANLQNDSPFDLELMEALLDKVMDGTLCLLYNNQEILFKNSFDRKLRPKEES